MRKRIGALLVSASGLSALTLFFLPFPYESISNDRTFIYYRSFFQHGIRFANWVAPLYWIYFLSAFVVFGLGVIRVALPKYGLGVYIAALLLAICVILICAVVVKPSQLYFLLPMGLLLLGTLIGEWPARKKKEETVEERP